MSMTEAPITSVSGNNEPPPSLLFIITVLVAVVLIVICCLLLELCSRRLEYWHHILRNQDHHRLHNVESGQVTGRHKTATLSMLELQYVQIDESSADFSSGCVICLDDFQKGEDCCVLSSCKHVFHSGCLKQWLDKNQSCPLCRNSV
ncbi:hypothetical protein SADUNF_Sadunf16G0264200 [Salix dunnii]|uniref:RING-type domain-containing protein n=1 Tax=Salix dunnii TaxID=1413687 RepID=A0A835JAL1_9ROSI|nr:hypothetical protein SADUNF_Sadunf16G0264200 [Salix dunnii]